MAGEYFEVQASGPLFDGIAEKAIEDFCKEAEFFLGNEALDLFETNLDESIRENGHVYTGFVRVTDEPEGRVVDDGWGATNDLPYGLWLEGIGSRNAPETVFEGYHSLERAADQLEENAPEILQELIDPYIAIANGE